MGVAYMKILSIAYSSLSTFYDEKLCLHFYTTKYSIKEFNVVRTNYRLQTSFLTRAEQINDNHAINR